MTPNPQPAPIRTAPAPCAAELAELFALRRFERDTRPASAFLPMPDSLVRAFAGEA